MSPLAQKVRLASWVAFAAGVAAVSGGLSAVLWDRVDTCWSRVEVSGGISLAHVQPACSSAPLSTLGWGVALLAIGALIAGIAVTLLLSVGDHRAKRTVGAMLGIIGAAAIAFGVAVYPVQSYTIGHREDVATHAIYAARATHPAALAAAIGGAALVLAALAIGLRRRSQ